MKGNFTTIKMRAKKKVTAVFSKHRIQTFLHILHVKEEKNII